MIQPQTYLNVADNSGARKLMCIRVSRSKSKSSWFDWRCHYRRCQRGVTEYAIEKI